MEDAIEVTEWWVYVLLSVDERRTYVGVAVDVSRRLRQHNGELSGGARSTRVGRPWRVAARFGPLADRSTACRCEAAVKRRRGHERLSWTPPEA